MGSSPPFVIILITIGNFASRQVPYCVNWPGQARRRIRAASDQLALRPNPSAMRETTRVFRLTPSIAALAASLAWRLFGTRCTHFPLHPDAGAGTGSLNSFAAASQERKASEPFSTACSIVSPSAMHPGRSGNSTSHPPPSAFDRRRIVKGCSIFFMATSSTSPGDFFADTGLIGFRSGTVSFVPEGCRNVT